MKEKEIIYFDNSATTIKKPEAVKQAFDYGLTHLGNAGRSFYEYSAEASREVFLARKEIARIFGVKDPLNVAFTSSATESLNLVIYGLLGEKDHVITTRVEHNSVLRPLHNCGAQLSFLPCDELGNIVTENMDSYLKSNTTAVVCTHGSNLTGNLSPVSELKAFCEKNGLLLILDVAQTAGTIELCQVDADFMCFTGHKGLLGPQGTGGIVFSGENYEATKPKIIKTGGSGSNSYDKLQPDTMPDVFEAGTHNTHGIYALKKACEYINELTVREIRKQEKELTTLFIDGISKIPEIVTYGHVSSKDKLPIVSINLKDMSSEDFAYKLWTDYKIATRAGSHCAPLLHEHFGTKQRGMVRFSFSHTNTEDEIRTAIDAIGEIAWSTS